MMTNWRKVLGWTIFLLFGFNAHAKSNSDQFYRSFWSPSYHGASLDYCTLEPKSCGLVVANKYCRLMGYDKSVQHIIAHNVGLTHFIGTKAQCKGWECDGFKLIRCVNKMRHTPIKAYYYRYEKFAYPKFDHYRVDWCYKKGAQCGMKAAHSFCRRMGYIKATKIKLADHVFATKAIGDQSLCFGEACKGFSQITCYR